MKTIRVQDKYDVVEFEGEQLAEVSTETPSATRWTEIEIYVTEAGNYVVHRTGRSVLYHRHDGPCNTGVARRAGELDELALPCDRCRPGEPDDLDPDTTVDEELDKHSVDVCTADQVYDRLLLKRANGETFMSNPAQRVYAMAVMADERLPNHLVRRVS